MKTGHSWIPACLMVFALLTPNLARSQSNAEILQEIRKISERLERVESKLAAVTGEEEKAEPSAGAPAETGCKGSFFRMDDLDIMRYPTPNREPDWSGVVSTEVFNPDELRDTAEYPTSQLGVSMWDGQIALEEGDYEFAFSWDRYFAPGSRPYLGTFQLTSPGDNTNLTIEAWSKGGVEDSITKDARLSGGIYNVKLVGCTYKYRSKGLSLVLRYRKRGGNWTTLQPIDLVPPRN